MCKPPETDSLRIGTCSWKYPAWKGLIYPDRTTLNYLKSYAEHFNTVEVDQWFWSLYGPGKIKMPEPGVVQEYVNSVPPGFKFTIKVPNSVTLTHFYKRTHPELTANPNFLSVDLFRTFLKILDPMKPYLGPLMFQFEYLNKQKMDSQDRFLNLLDGFFRQIPDGYAYTIELRNPNYLNSQYFDFLNKHDVFHVFLQGYYMPSIFDLFNTYVDRIQNQTVIRLLGADRKGIEERSGGHWNRIVDPKDDELNSILTMLKHLQARQISVYLNVNNHYEGCAPLTINKIKQGLTSYSDTRIQNEE